MRKRPTYKTALGICLVVVVLTLSGCILVPGVRYDFKLESVKRAKETKAKYGEEGAISVEGGHPIYEDKLLRIKFEISLKNINFFIKNKTDDTIRLIWDEAIYIDRDNSSHNVMHAGTRFLTRVEAQIPSVIASGGTIEDLVCPTDYVSYSSGLVGYGGGWKQKNLLPQSGAEGGLIGVLLPFEVENVTNEYTFLFRILPLK